MLKQQHGSSHGKWLAWLKEHVGIEDRTAQNYVKLARNKAKYETVSHLGVRQALKLAGKTSSAGDVDAGGETVRSLSDGRDIAGEDRSSEGEQASSGSRASSWLRPRHTRCRNSGSTSLCKWNRSQDPTAPASILMICESNRR